MDLATVIGAVACSGQLALTLLAASRARRSSTVAALARLSASMFGWTFAGLMHELTEMRAFHVLDVSISPLVPPLVLDFVVRFVQRAHALRAVVGVAYAGAAALSLLSALSPFWAFAAAVEDSAWWGGAFVLVGYPSLVLSAILLRRDLALRATAADRRRTHLLLAALLVAASFGITDLLGKSGFETVRLASLGTLISGVLMSIGALRFRLVDRNPSLVVGGYVFGAAVLVIAAFSTAVHALQSQPALLAVAACLVTAGVALFVARLTRMLDVERSRADQLVFLGRAADQMAHDLRNPIAALKGALQFLQEESARGRSLDQQGPMVELAATQVQRLESLVTRYRRLGRLDPELTRVDVEALVRSTVASHRQASASPIELRVTSATELVACELDQELITAALDNVIRNAVEAAGGSQQQDAIVVDLRCDGDWLTICVTDHGPGIAPDVLPRVFDEFYTTKADGSGLGLPFVRRVVEAHGGRVTLRSERGVRTSVEMTLPIISRRST